MGRAKEAMLCCPKERRADPAVGFSFLFDLHSVAVEVDVEEDV